MKRKEADQTPTPPHGSVEKPKDNGAKPPPKPISYSDFASI